MSDEEKITTTGTLATHLADLIDRALAHLSKADVIASFEQMLKEVRAGVFDPSLPS